MKTIITFFALLMFSCTLSAQEKEAVVKVLEDQRQAWNRGDIEAYMQGYWKSDSLVFVGKDAPVYGWKKKDRSL